MGGKAIDAGVWLIHHADVILLLLLGIIASIGLYSAHGPLHRGFIAASYGGVIVLLRFVVQRKPLV